MKSADEETTEETLDGPLYGDENRIYAEVARVILGEKAFPVAPTDALELSRILDAIRIAGEENRVVML